MINSVIPFRPLRRRPAPAANWTTAYLRFWTDRLDRLAAYLGNLTDTERETIMSLPLEDSRTLVISRVLKAPRELVWKMFADPYHLAQWWGPKGYTNRVERLDFRTGGSWLHVMIGPDGRELPTDNVILEVTPPERIVYRNAPADPKLFGDNPPPGFTKTVTFEMTDDGNTRLVLVCSFDTAEHKDRVTARGFSIGTNESFDKLERYLAAV